MPISALDVLLSLVVIIVQTTVVRYLAIGLLVPDLPLIWIVILTIRRGQTTGTVSGFGIGLLLDLLSGAEGLIGLGALVKTAAGFLAGFFFHENKTWHTLGSYQFLIAVAIISFVHNSLYFLVLLQGSEYSAGESLLRFGFPSTLYTTAAALLPMFVFARRIRS
jgi:rod shape-determining protein MreD